MRCEKCGGSGYIPGVPDDEPCSECSPSSEAFQRRVIASFIRHVNKDDDCDMTDALVIEHHGGDASNRIIANGSDGTYLYRAIDSGTTTYTIIDTNDLSKSTSLEVFPVLDHFDDLVDSDGDDLLCVSR
jgi:hypothetical protein